MLSAIKKSFRCRWRVNEIKSMIISHKTSIKWTHNIVPEAGIKGMDK